MALVTKDFQIEVSIGRVRANKHYGTSNVSIRSDGFGINEFSQTITIDCARELREALDRLITTYDKEKG